MKEVKNTDIKLYLREFQANSPILTIRLFKIIIPLLNLRKDDTNRDQDKLVIAFLLLGDDLIENNY